MYKDDPIIDNIEEQSCESCNSVMVPVISEYRPTDPSEDLYTRNTMYCRRCGNFQEVVTISEFHEDI